MIADALRTVDACITRKSFGLAHDKLKALEQVIARYPFWPADVQTRAATAIATRRKTIHG